MISQEKLRQKEIGRLSTFFYNQNLFLWQSDASARETASCWLVLICPIFLGNKTPMKLVTWNRNSISQPPLQLGITVLLNFDQWLVSGHAMFNFLEVSLRKETAHSFPSSWGEMKVCEGWLHAVILDLGVCLRWCLRHLELYLSGLAYCNKNTIDCGALNNRKLLFTVLKSECPRLRCQQICCLLRAFSWFADGHLLSVFTWWRETMNTQGMVKQQVTRSVWTVCAWERNSRVIPVICSCPHTKLDVILTDSLESF